MTVTSSSHVDVVNNTLYHNVQTDEPAKQKYPWGDLILSGPLPNCQDVRVFNNIIYSAPGRPIVVGGRVEDYTLKYNVYFGDPNAPFAKGDAGDTDNRVADPKLVAPSTSGTPEDFRPTAGSPAIGHGTLEPIGVPLADLTGKLRSAGPVTAGALLPAER